MVRNWEGETEKETDTYSIASSHKKFAPCRWEQGSDSQVFMHCNLNLKMLKG